MDEGFLKWFLLATLILALGSGFCAQDPCVFVDACHGKCHSDAGGGAPGNPCSDSDCPQDHQHHQGICTHANPLLSSFELMAALLPPHGSLMGVSHSSDEVPDGPVLEKDVPPIV